MKKRTVNYVILIFALLINVILINMLDATEVQASTATGVKAKKAYAEFLSGKTVKLDCGNAVAKYIQFSNVDINNDGIDELFVKYDDYLVGYTEIYTYLDGKVTLCKIKGVDICDKGTEKQTYNATFDNGCAVCYTGKNLLNINGSQCDDGWFYYYTFSANVFSLKAGLFTHYVDENNTSEIYWVNDKYVSKKIFERYVKKIVEKSDEYVEFEHQNTNTNRNQFLLSKINLSNGATTNIDIDVSYSPYIIKFTTNKKSVATVNKIGKITAKKTGTAIITASVKYGNHSKKYKFTINVK